MPRWTGSLEAGGSREGAGAARSLGLKILIPKSQFGIYQSQFLNIIRFTELKECRENLSVRDYLSVREVPLGPEIF